MKPVLSLFGVLALHLAGVGLLMALGIPAVKIFEEKSFIENLSALYYVIAIVILASSVLTTPQKIPQELKKPVYFLMIVSAVFFLEEIDFLQYFSFVSNDFGENKIDSLHDYPGVGYARLMVQSTPGLAAFVLCMTGLLGQTTVHVICRWCKLAPLAWIGLYFMLVAQLLDTASPKIYFLYASEEFLEMGTAAAFMLYAFELRKVIQPEIKSE